MPAPRVDKGATVLSLNPDAELIIAASADASSRALRAGARAPLFTLADRAGRQVALQDILRAGPVVLHFFRGAWCSFGNEGVAEFASSYQDVIAMGASAVVIAPPCSKATQRVLLPMPELVDVDMKIARAYGLAFELPASLRSGYEQLGYTPPTTKKADDWLVPLPATYLLDHDGVVALAFIDVDYRNHCGCDSILTALKALKSRRAPNRASSIIRRRTRRST